MKLRLPAAPWIRVVLALAGFGVATSLVIGREAEAPARLAGAASTVRAPETTTAAPRGISKLNLAALGRPIAVDVDDKLFYVPPPPAPPPPATVPRPVVAEAPPPKPVAPPLPFTFMGRLIDNGATTVFVSHNGNSLMLKQGDQAAELYRVEQISQSEVVFVYEPLAERQVLAIGVAQ